MEDGGGEGELRTSSWIQLRQSNLEVEIPIAIRCVWWPGDQTTPTKHVFVVVRGGGACWERVILKVQPLFLESS